MFEPGRFRGLWSKVRRLLRRSAIEGFFKLASVSLALAVVMLGSLAVPAGPALAVCDPTTDLGCAAQQTTNTAVNNGTPAGVSTASGVGNVSGGDGIWENVASVPGIALVFQILDTICYGVVTLLLKFDILLTDVLIEFATYNTFTTAPPVLQGWPLVRDVCNMFFVVVLLIIAFSTIIGYEPFHYRQYLAKLLLMAVLINFSKTLIGLLIDFSQVVFLTFVVGFQNAAFGNFAQGLQLTSVLNLGSNDAIPTLGNLLLTLIFSIVILTIASTTLMILIVYILARILGLWIALILSPIAFFATALPSKMQNALSVFTKSYWSQLSAWLTGGPIVAFFLWLALATIQQNSANPFGVNTNRPDPELDAAMQNNNLGDNGKPANFTNFIVAIAFMLFGVKAAVDVSGQAAPALGGLAKEIQRGGGPVNRFVGRPAARLAGRAARGAATGATTAIDARLGLSSGLGKGLTSIGQSLGGVRGFGAVGAGIAGLGLSAQNISKGRQETQNKAIEGQLKGLGSSDQLKQLELIKNSGNREERNYAIQKMALIAASKGGKKGFASDAEKDLSRLIPDANTAKAAAGAAAVKKQAAYIDEAEALAKKNNDTASIDAINEERKKNPSLFGSKYNDLSKQVANGDFKDISTDARADSSVMLAMLASKGLVDERTGGLKGGYQDSKDWKELAGGKGNSAKYFKALERDLGTDKGKTRARAQLAAMREGANADTIAAANEGRQVFHLADNGDIVSGAYQPPTNDAGKLVYGFGATPTRELLGEERQISDFNDLTRNLEPARRASLAAAYPGVNQNEFAQRFSRSLSNDQAVALTQAAGVYSHNPANEYSGPEVAAISHVQASGISPSAVNVYDPSADEISEPASNAIGGMYYNTFNQLGSGVAEQRTNGIQVLANTDVEAIRQGKAAGQTIVTSIETQVNGPDGVNKLKTAYREASEEQRKKIESVMKEIAATAAKAANTTGARTPGQVAAIRIKATIMAGEDKGLKAMFREPTPGVT